MPVRGVLARRHKQPARRRVHSARRAHACARLDPTTGRSHRFATLALEVALTLAVLVLSSSPARAETRSTFVFTPVADVALNKADPGARHGRDRWLWVGGSGYWRSYVRFRVHGVEGRVRRATLLLRAPRGRRLALKVRVGLRRRGGWRERSLRLATAPRPGAVAAAWRRSRRVPRSLKVDVTRAVRRNRTLDLVLTGRSRRPLRLFSREAASGRPRLRVEAVQRRRKARRRPRAPLVTAPRPAATPAPAPASPPGRIPVDAVWITRAEIAARPTAGPAWTALKAAADAPPGTPHIADQDSDHDVATLAAALVAARTGLPEYLAKAQAGIAAAIGTEHGGRVLALARNLTAYVVAADVVDLARTDAALDARFRAWLAAVRTEVLDGHTLIDINETQANNWGTIAGAARAAADVYLGDNADLQRTATIFRGWLGDRAAYAGFVFDSDLSWQGDPAAPVGLNPAGTVVGGVLVDGALPEDMRRGCPLTIPPCQTVYAWEGLQGALVQAGILSRHGYDAWNWSARGLLRASSFLARLDATYGGWWATGDDAWQPWVINHAYGTSFPAITPTGAGKILGWTDWMYG